MSTAYTLSPDEEELLLAYRKKKEFDRGFATGVNASLEAIEALHKESLANIDPKIPDDEIGLRISTLRTALTALRPPFIRKSF
jgi:hypothetical protein